MIVIDTRTNQVHCNLSKTEVGRIVGVHRSTVIRWKKNRQQDGTHKEVYNFFEIYFNTKTYKQAKKGVHLLGNQFT
jgi:hypothetical protein